jgi:hypothetical protein
LALSVCVFTHVEPHSSVPLGQTHADELHTLPPVHAIPHAPQLLGSLRKSTHELLQLVVGPVQFVVHIPAEHTCIDVHAVAQSPQCALSVRGSMQVPPQLIRPVGHAHAPAVQT